MCEDTYTIKCYACDKEYKMTVKSHLDIDWDCPNCNLSDNTAIIDYEPGDKEFYTREISFGKGGALHA